jgi:putative protease
MFEAVFAVVDPKEINYLNRIMESYEYLGVVTTIDRQGLVLIRVTPDTFQDVIDILLTLPIDVEIV